MTMPVALILVRHGQSEGNEANARSRAGDHSLFTPEFDSRHSSSWRLTDRGKVQAKAAGDWIKEKMVLPFDRHYTSEYIRALETAACLGLPNANWYIEPYLRERDYGKLDVMRDDLRQKKYKYYLEQRKRNPLFSIPPNGESMVTVCLRIDRVLNTLHRECGDKRVIIVCHGEVIDAFRIRLERLTEEKYKALANSEDQRDRVYNGQIFHYSRRDPETGKLAPHANWVRTIRLLDPSFPSEWRRIERPKYSNEDLFAIVRQMPRMINNE